MDVGDFGVQMKGIWRAVVDIGPVLGKVIVPQKLSRSL